MQQANAGPDPADAAAPDVLMQLLRVDVAGHRCAFPVEAVVEIHAAVQLTPLPDAPEMVLGLVNRRGRPLPVLDLRRLLGLTTRAVELDDRLVVLRLVDREAAVLVDVAVDLLNIPAVAVDEAVARATAALRSRGVAVLEDGLLVILDVTTFLSPDEAWALDEALQRFLAASS